MILSVVITSLISVDILWNEQDAEEFRDLQRRLEMVVQQLENERRETERLNKDINALRMDAIMARRDADKASREVMHYELWIMVKLDITYMARISCGDFCNNSMIQKPTKTNTINTNVKVIMYITDVIL